MGNNSNFLFRVGGILLLMMGCGQASELSLGNDYSDNEPPFPQQVGGSAGSGFNAGNAGTAGMTKLCGNMIGSVQCSSEEFCDFSEAQACATAQIFFGNCNSRPTSCPTCFQTTNSVCGCDGILYCSECLANLAGVDITPDKTMCTGGTKKCGSWLGDICPSEQFCDFASIQCGKNGETGVCLVKPSLDVCPVACNPICGCDGKQYCNECFANHDGIDVDPNGSCP
jgi:hypothetical protein